MDIKAFVFNKAKEAKEGAQCDWLRHLQNRKIKS